MSIDLVLEVEIGYTTRIDVAPSTISNVLMLHTLVAGLHNMNISCRKSFLIHVRHLGWVIPIEQAHNDQHQYCVEDEEKVHVSQKVPIVALQVLNHTEDASDHDQSGRNVQNVHVPPPRKPMGTGQSGV